MLDSHFQEILAKPHLNLLANYNSCLSLSLLFKVCENAMKQYKRTRPDPSAASIRRAKELPTHRIHPLLFHHLRGSGGGGGMHGLDASIAVDFMHSLQKFRPKATVFEVCHF